MINVDVAVFVDPPNQSFWWHLKLQKKYQTFDQNVYKLPKFSTLQMYQYRVSVFVQENSVFLLQTNLALNDGLLVDMNKWLMQTKMPSIIWLSSLISVTFSSNSQLQQSLGLFQILLFLSKCIVLYNNIEHFQKFEFLISFYFHLDFFAMWTFRWFL